ncbi:MAG: preprotein translocase subunit SecA [Deltaproteobacteria bacterium]|nr:preprotein translocase subunit SecA [Deltaproteobacteria bacterium]
MIGKALTKVFGSKNDREIKELRKIVVKINNQEPSVEPLSDDELREKTVEFRERVAQGESLDALLPEAFAVCREAGKRVLGERLYDVQLIGAIVLHQGRIAEMKTGEGKTLTSTAAVYLNNFLGLSTGAILHDMDDEDRRAAYAADVTYGTNNEFGFDYLRDNMKFDVSDFCQRGFNYAIVDEVDSILIDEARTPLIISGPAEMSTDMYLKVDRIMKHFKEDEHYTKDEKARQSMLTDEGVMLGEELLDVENLYDPRNINQLHHINQALKAHVLFQRDVDYIVKNGEVVIVDEFTGRTMEGRRYSDGLHQALEAKEGVKIEKENQTLASITFQNYFRMYEKLAGMTGTADTEAPEFKKIYNLDVVIIPTNQDMIRDDYADVIYKNQKAKYRAIVQEIKDLHEKGQPVLVGTISIDVSEKISNMLKKEKIPHDVLNAKQHEREAEIVADAGHKGKITIATNMAGRGTDIKLGEGVRELDGLHILGTSRHESRRIDNQLRGRSGRQGDAGSSRFFLSLEDDLLRIFGSGRLSSIMDKLGMEEDEPIEHSMISKAIENAQRKVEGHNFDIRKHLLEYDDVMNKQREVIYGQRREVLQSDNVTEIVEDMVSDLVERTVAGTVRDRTPSEDWDWQAFDEQVSEIFNISLNWNKSDRQDLDFDSLQDKLRIEVDHAYQAQTERNKPEQMLQLERMILLQMVDTHWKEHLLNMDHLKEGIGLRGYGQKNPLDEYKKEGFNLFLSMIETVKEQTVSTLMRVQIVQDDEVARLEAEQRRQREKELEMAKAAGAGTEDQTPKTVRRQEEKVGRNAPCPCGSGKKFKKCCGKLS